jgi:uncharacterized protein (TIGR03083 family)
MRYAMASSPPSLFGCPARAALATAPFGDKCKKRTDNTGRAAIDKHDYLQVLASDAAALAAAAGRGLAAAVPSCPGWSVADLVVHTGAVHRSQAAIVAERAQEPPAMRREMFEPVPGLLAWLERSALMGGRSDLAAIPPGLVEWFEEGAGILTEALRNADPSEPVWSWSATKRVSHYLRMMPIETAVHRWDAQLAHGQPEPIERALAAEGVGHTFEVMMPMRRSRQAAAPGQGESYRFVQTDGLGIWEVRFDGEPAVSTGGSGAADVTLRGPASDLFLFLWHRLPASDLDVQGDAALLERYFELVPPI